MRGQKRFAVGQEVVVDPRTGPQYTAVVTKVGHKYVTTVEGAAVGAYSRTREFDVGTGRLRGITFGGDQLFTIEDWGEERLLRAERKRTERHRSFLLGRSQRLSRADLTRLNDLLDELNPPKGTS